MQRTPCSTPEKQLHEGEAHGGKGAHKHRVFEGFVFVRRAGRRTKQALHIIGQVHRTLNSTPLAAQKKGRRWTACPQELTPVLSVCCCHNGVFLLYR